MTFKGRIIKGGDVLWTDRGWKFTISDWSESTGDIYGRNWAGIYMHIDAMPELFWEYPFVSSRNRRHG